MTKIEEITQQINEFKASGYTSKNSRTYKNLIAKRSGMRKASMASKSKEEIQEIVHECNDFQDKLKTAIAQMDIILNN